MLWKARIHKSGTKVQIFDGDRMVREIEASADTFEPAEAKEFAETLLGELNARTAEQMKEPSAEPSVTTKSEEHLKSTEEVEQEAKGVGADEEKQDEEEDEEEKQEMSEEIGKLQTTISGLKSSLKKEQGDRLLERKARRGLAIAKQLVADGELEDDYDSIKKKVSEISSMETSEIIRLEKKVAGESEFDSIDEAKREARRQKRITRVNRVAAQEAQEDNDEVAADDLDRKADIAEKKAVAYEKIAEDMGEEETEIKEEEIKEEIKEIQDEELEDLEKQDEEDEPEDLEEKQDEPEKKEEKDEPEDLEEKQDEEDDETKEAKTQARRYRRIAADHRKNAEKLEAKGKTAQADKEDEKADEAEEKAEEIEEVLEQAGYVEDKKELQDEEKKEDLEEKQDEEEKKEEDEDLEEKQDEEEKKEEDEPEDLEEKQDEEEEKKEEDEEEKKANKKPLKREGSVIDGFGFDKSASVEENPYSGSSETDKLSSMWRGAPKDGE